MLSKTVIPAERSEGRDPPSRVHPGSRHGALLTQRLAGMTFRDDVDGRIRIRPPLHLGLLRQLENKPR